MSPMNNRKLVPQKLPLLLDYAPGAAAAYSLRSLSNSYTGPVVRGRRGVDAAQRDFTPSEITDGTVQAWNDEVGSTGVIVTTWYDQSGNGNDAVQATSAYMPVLYSAATGLVTEGGKPAIRFDGGDDRLVYVGNFLGGSAASAFCVSAFTNATRAAREIIFGLQDPTGTRYDFLLTRQSSADATRPNAIDFYVEGNNPTGDLFAVTDTDLRSYAVLYSDTVRYEVFSDGAFRYAEASASLGDLDDGTQFIIGADISAGSNPLDGAISELILYPFDMTALRDRITADQMWYY